jgi:hypothetical protein
MRMSVRLTVALGGLLVCGAAAAQSHQAVRDQLFADTDAAKHAADERDARTLAPLSYAAGMKHYVEATETLEKGRDIDDVRGELVLAKEQFERASEAATLAEVTFANALEAREPAQRAEAPRYAERDWKRAEAAFQSVAEQLEGGNLKKATADAVDVAQHYRVIEARAISAKARAGN